MTKALEEATAKLKTTLIEWQKMLAEKARLEDLMVQALEHYSKIQDQEAEDGE